MNYRLRILFTLLLVLHIVSCSSSDDGPETEDLIDPADANAISQVLIFPSGSNSNQGQPPAPSGTSDAPVINNNVSSINSSNGATTPLNFEFSNVGNALNGCYVQVVGASTYYDIPYNVTSSSNGNLVLPLGIPTNVTAGEFEVAFCVYDSQGRISNVIVTSISVLRLGTGSLQISLSWDDDSDQDLYVTDPSGETISYLNRSSNSGGQLDRDDTNGFGPENVFWIEDAPDGTYSVVVDAFSTRSTLTNFYVTVSAPNGGRSFSGTNVNGSETAVVTFTKSGNNVSF